MDSSVRTGSTLESTWCPTCGRHAVDLDGYCTACGSIALMLGDDE